jgi:hypothetical protein
MTVPTHPVESDPVLRALANEIYGYETVIDDLPVAPAVTPGDIRNVLSRYDFANPIRLEELIGEVADLMRRWSLHVNHPRYFGWRLVNDSPLAIVCFTHPKIEAGTTTAAEVVDRVLATGRAWISQVRLSGRVVALRACITSHRTTPDDVEILVDELQRAIGP